MRGTTRGLVVALAVLSAGLTQVSTNAVLRRFPLIDEAGQRPDFLTFRAELIAAVGRRDAGAIRGVIDRQIRYSFGDDPGIVGFEERWRFESPESEFWQEFGEVLALGGSFVQPDAFVAPYVFANWPDDLDVFDHLAVVGRDVHVRAAPRLDAASLGRVTFGILARQRAEDFDVGDDWMAVQFGGRVGFVSARFARSPIGYRAYFGYQEGRWRLTTFIAGD